jgi:Tol biopolymer transport system component
MKRNNAAFKSLSCVWAVFSVLAVAQSALADFFFTTPKNCGPSVNSAAYGEYGPSISADGLSFYFTSDRPGGSGEGDMWVMSRPSEEEPWDKPVNLGPTVNSTAEDSEPCISADGLELYFHSTRPEGYGNQDLWVSTRRTTDDEWGTPANLGQDVNTQYHDGRPSLSSDGLLLFFNSNRPGGVGRYELWMTARTTRSDPWAEPVWVGPVVNSPHGHGASSCFSGDGRTLFFASIRNCGFGSCDIWEVPIVSIEGSTDATRDTSVTE